MDKDLLFNHWFKSQKSLKTVQMKHFSEVTDD